MAENSGYLVTSGFVTMEQGLVEVSITPEWRVLVNDDKSRYAPEQAVCLLALIRNMNGSLTAPWLRQELKDIDEETGGRASKVIDPESSDIDAVLDDIKQVKSGIATNFFRLRKETLRIALLIDNAADFQTADEKVARYFVANPDRAHIEHIARGTFRTAYLDRERALKHTPPKRYESEAPNGTFELIVPPYIRESSVTLPSKTKPIDNGNPVVIQPPTAELVVRPPILLNRKDFMQSVKQVIEGLEKGSEISRSDLPVPKNPEDLIQVINILEQGGYKVVK